MQPLTCAVRPQKSMKANIVGVQHMKLNSISVKVTNLKQLLSGVLACFLIVSCNNTSSINQGSTSSANQASPSPSNQLSQDAKDTAINFIKNSPFCTEGRECKNFDAIPGLTTVRIKPDASATSEPLSAADKENGVEERWYFNVTYVQRLRGKQEWTDDSTLCTSEKRNGTWKALCNLGTERRLSPPKL